MADKKVRFQNGGGLSDGDSPWNIPAPTPSRVNYSNSYKDASKIAALGLLSMFNPGYTPFLKQQVNNMAGRITPSNRRNPYVANRTGGGADEFALAMERQRAWEEMQKQRSVDSANKRISYLQARQGNAGALGYGGMGYGDMGANSNLNMGLYDTNWQNWRDVPKNWINEKLYEQNLPPDDTSDGGGGGYYGGYGGYSGGGGSRGGYNPYAWYFSLLNWRI